jgi:hypothetical protein
MAELCCLFTWFILFDPADGGSYIPPKRQETSTTLHGVIYLKAVISLSSIRVKTKPMSAQ